ncbi:hypothetical protein N7532_004543 [Penicillium argentinense]|uniref:Uncharacterized protein n=1 Tax=Penicillium argentinense TaxID=1131581 RepID=A0A9W9FPN8_9EURO|nr:uncharacterized protein N7532_004543 [Penicillium argentinense]KAJ5104014.1 hypothetical protein N7532_004543 [Penicillium argentinense]
MAPSTFFLYEETTSFSYHSEGKEYSQMQYEGPTIQNIPRTLELSEDSNQYKIFLLGGLNRDAMSVIDNPSLVALYDAYYREHVATIIVRPRYDDLPSTTQAPSSVESLQERRSRSGVGELENPTLNPTPSAFPPLVGDVLRPVNDFLDFWELLKQVSNDRKVHLKMIFEAYSYLENNAQIFMQDLMKNLKSVKPRFKSDCSPYYLGAPYFSEEKYIADILATPLYPSTTLKKRLDEIRGWSYCLSLSYA